MSEFFRRDKLKPGNTVVFLSGKDIIIDTIKRVGDSSVETKQRYYININELHPTKEALLESLVTLDHTK